MPKKITFFAIGLALISLSLFFVFKKKSSSPKPTATPQSNQITALNTIPITKRPFATLTPDSSGHNLFFHLENPQTQATIEYEIVYTAGNKEEGAFGHLDLAQEKPPVTKKIFLGSKSAGGAVTYHQGITGGSLTLTYSNIKLKEDFGFLRFDPQNPDGYSSVDARFTAYFKPKQLAKNAVVLIMKSFGLPAPLPQGKILAGPYYVGTAKKVAPQKIELKVSGNQPILYEYVEGKWAKLEAEFKNGLLTATPSGNLFVVVE